MQNPVLNTLANKSIFFVPIVLLYSCSDMNKSPEPTPPMAKQIKAELTLHNHTRVDNYYWLNERENPEVVDYLEQENNYTASVMKHTEAFQDQLYEEIVGRIKPSDESVPYLLDGYQYYRRYEEGKEYPIYCRKENVEGAKEQIMIDVNEMAKGKGFMQVGSPRVSQNNYLIAFGVDTLGRRIYTLQFKNLETGEILEDQIPNTTGSAAWANDNKTVFYTKKDDALRSYKIFKHTLGTPASEDVEVFHEKDETFSTFVYKTKSKKYIIIGSVSTVSSEYRFLDANEPSTEFTVVQPRARDLEYSISHYGDHFYLRTNLEAKNFRLMKTPTHATSKEHWEEVIPHRADVLLEEVELFSNYLVVSERKNGLIKLRVMPWENLEGGHYIEFPDPAYTAYISINPAFETTTLRYGYTSLTTPSSTYDYNMSTKEQKLLKRQEVVGDFKPENYKSERLFATARDGKKIPISLVYHKDTKPGPSTPLLQYGYGSYGASIDAYFSSVRLSLLDRGFIFAIAHIRGGEELGRTWYEDGKLLNKKNTFNDFVDCSEHLISSNYTSSDNLFAMGGSAGGLLMGAVVNMRPDLYKGVVAAVPFVDVVTTMLDESIPLTTGEYDEWGNPNEKEYYDYILSYSPYDNVEAKAYPAMLVTTGLHDSQVQYWEPAKWVAKLRTKKTDDNPLLLHTNMSAGHSGSSGRFERHRETALEYAFILDLAGINE